jgi:NAD(P)H-hydrate epimerase
MKILSATQIRQADQYTIEHEPLSSIDLMERAALTCVHWLKEHFTQEQEFAIVCGTGNNGGDGLAIGRLLRRENYRVHAYVIGDIEKGSADFKENYERLPANFRTDISSVAELEKGLKEQPIIIDALFGSGLNRPVTDLAAEVIRSMNGSGCSIISIDIPSGLYCDRLNAKEDVIVCAEQTLSFLCPKLSFMYPENAAYVGEFSILDIRLQESFINELKVQEYFLLKQDIVSFLKKRGKAAHKGNFGHALLVAGSKGKTGAAVLASRACMRSGAGLLTTHVPACGYAVMQAATPEVMLSTDKNENFISEITEIKNYDAIGIGPGIGKEDQTAAVLKSILEKNNAPLVLDADALNIIAERQWLSILPAESILTPHPKEFGQLAGKTADSEERIQLQRKIAVEYKLYIILKGAHTSVAAPDGTIYFNSTGNPGMATAGSGDVLTGIIASLIAQKYSPLQACLLGVYLHGLAGDLAAAEKSEEGMIASDLIECLPGAFNFLHA